MSYNNGWVRDRAFVEKQGVGSIEFLCPSDCSDVILGENVIIDHGYVEVEAKYLKNSSAIVTLNNISGKHIHQIDLNLQQRGAKVLSYDKITKEIQFFVPHFSEYNIRQFILDSDEEAEDNDDDDDQNENNNYSDEDDDFPPVTIENGGDYSFEGGSFFSEDDDITETESESPGQSK